LTNPDNPNIINFDLWKQADGGRHQIGTMAGFRSEQVAGFLLECMAGFVGIRRPVSLAAFKCDTITRSSFIQRVCYDEKNAYMLINLSGTWYHYCEIGRGMVSNLLAAESMGRFCSCARKLSRSRWGTRNGFKRREIFWLASLLGVSRPYLGRVLSGEKPMAAEVIDRLRSISI
jgi:hypothetical protein